MDLLRVAFHSWRSVPTAMVLPLAYELFVRRITGKEKKIARNARDRVFNITLYKEDAQAVASILYYEGCISIPRKRQMALLIQTWRRPHSMRKVPNKKFWTEEQDHYILAHTIEDSVMMLQRSIQSVKMRLWRLHGSNK